MFKTVAEFQQFLTEQLGTGNVYFQPPETVRMSYPAFKYNLAKIDNVNANNSKYLQGKAYTLTYITYDPDDSMVDTIASWRYCVFDRAYAANNLNYFVYTIYY